MNPWHDEFDSDNGRIVYCGDNKSAGRDADQAPGNRLLLEQLRIHSSPDSNTRRNAVPLVFFERATVDGRAKGQVVFHGFGVITSATLLTQCHPATGEYFPNYRFEFCVFALAESAEEFDWGMDCCPAQPRIDTA